MKVTARILSKTLVALLLTISFSSCATMFSGTKADIFIDGDVDEPVTINSSAGAYEGVSLPTIVEVKRRKLNGQHIQISSEHHSFDDIVLEKTINGWAVVGAIVYGVPLVVDLMTNAVSKPKYDQFYIVPIDHLTAADSLRKKRPTVMVSTMEPATRARLRGQQLPAQYPRHEVNATFGFGPNQADHSTKRFREDFLEPIHLEKESECGNIFGDSYVMGKLEYHYRLNRKWDIGALAAWGRSSESYTDEYYYAVPEHQQGHSGNVTQGYSRCRTFSLAPSVRYTWYETPTYRLFSRASLGVMRHHLQFDIEEKKFSRGSKPNVTVIRDDSNDEIKWRMAYQLSPIGISVGAGPLRFVAELGYGCLGVCNLGLSYCF